MEFSYYFCQRKTRQGTLLLLPTSLFSPCAIRNGEDARTKDWDTVTLILKIDKDYETRQ